MFHAPHGGVTITSLVEMALFRIHDDVIKWKHFPCYWPFVWGIHRSPVNSPHKGQWRWALTFALICVWINDWVNKREAGDLRRYRAHYDVIVMSCCHVDYLTWKRFPHYWPLCEKNPSVTGGFSSQSVGVTFDVSQGKLLYKQATFRWLETLRRSYDVTEM